MRLVQALWGRGCCDLVKWFMACGGRLEVSCCSGCKRGGDGNSGGGEKQRVNSGTDMRETRDFM